jgi:hypothetical protein
MPQSNIKIKIDLLLQQWEHNNRYRSDINTSDPAYKEIVAMGAEAVPHLLAFLGTSWAVIEALHDIVGDSPVYTEDAGRFDKINEVWLKWGQDKGYI